MNFRKTYFILPNLFTLAGGFCGFYAISLCARLGDEGQDSDLLYKAALAIMAGFFFDATDGRIARMTKTQSELGLHLDSLCDAITFGVAPALLVYRWGLEPLGRLGLFVAFLFMACGALRLARFNVLSLREHHEEQEAHGVEKKPGKYMLGLPIPIAASFLVGLVLVYHAIGIERAESGALIACVVTGLSYLMISRVKFRSMKDVHFNRRSFGVLVLIGALGVVVATKIHAPAVFMAMVGTYVGLGLVEAAMFWRKREELPVALAPHSLTVAEAAEEEEVLEELGAHEQDVSAGIP